MHLLVQNNDSERPSSQRGNSSQLYFAPLFIVLHGTGQGGRWARALPPPSRHPPLSLARSVPPSVHNVTQTAITPKTASHCNGQPTPASPRQPVPTDFDLKNVGTSGLSRSATRPSSCRGGRQRGQRLVRCCTLRRAAEQKCALLLRAGRAGAGDAPPPPAAALTQGYARRAGATPLSACARPGRRGGAWRQSGDTQCRGTAFTGPPRRIGAEPRVADFLQRSYGLPREPRCERALQPGRSGPAPRLRADLT